MYETIMYGCLLSTHNTPTCRATTSCFLNLETQDGWRMLQKIMGIFGRIGNRLRLYTEKIFHVLQCALSLHVLPVFNILLFPIGFLHHSCGICDLPGVPEKCPFIISKVFHRQTVCQTSHALD